MTCPQPIRTDRPVIRVVVVDDEPLARTGLLRLLQQEPDITVVAEGRSGPEAVHLIRAYRPDLIFLDIQMPEMDGFEVIQSLQHNERPAIIFVAACDRYAVRAFDVHALDYLLKPYSPDRLRLAVDRARQNLRHHNDTAQPDEMLSDMHRERTPTGPPATVESGGAGRRYLERIVIKSTGRIEFLKILDVDWIEAAADYVRLHARGREHIVRAKISDLEQRLDPHAFLRIHRSTIVRLDRIKELRPLFHGDFLVVLHDSTELTLSRSYRGRLAQFLDRPV